MLWDARFALTPPSVHKNSAASPRGESRRYEGRKGEYSSYFLMPEEGLEPPTRGL
jgi:hypothetical protein